MYDFIDEDNAISIYCGQSSRLLFSNGIPGSWSASRNSPLSAYSQSFLLSAGPKHDQRKVNIPLKQHIPSCYNQAFISYIDIKINSIVDFWIFYL
jgi:hypothetical protein